MYRAYINFIIYIDNKFIFIIKIQFVSYYYNNYQKTISIIY